MKKHKISLSFTSLSNSELAMFAERILVALTDNAAFAKPLVPLADLKAAITTFKNAMNDAATGDRTYIATRNQSREVLVDLLTQLAAYVQAVAGNDLPKLTTSGFDIVTRSRVRAPLPRPVIESVENPGTKQLALRLRRVPSARAYEVRMSYGANGWQAAGIFTQARSIVLEDLTPGTVYTIQARAIGGSTGASEWSDPVSRMSL